MYKIRVCKFYAEMKLRTIKVLRHSFGCIHALIFSFFVRSFIVVLYINFPLSTRTNVRSITAIWQIGTAVSTEPSISTTRKHCWRQATYISGTVRCCLLLGARKVQYNPPHYMLLPPHITKDVVATGDWLHTRWHCSGICNGCFTLRRY